MKILGSYIKVTPSCQKRPFWPIFWERFFFVGTYKMFAEKTCKMVLGTHKKQFKIVFLIITNIFIGLMSVVISDRKRAYHFRVFLKIRKKYSKKGEIF